VFNEIASKLNSLELGWKKQHWKFRENKIVIQDSVRMNGEGTYSK
jgi:hypothetical protein